MNDRKVILFGGTFDPIHLGHTKVASAAAQYVGAERLIFIPAKRSPLKGATPRASDIDRLNMISCSISGKDFLEVTDYELNKPAPSYTLNTVRHFKSLFGDGYTFYWLLGADSINDLVQWYHVEELIDECNLAAMYRAGFDKPDFARYGSLWGRPRVEKLQRNVIPTPLIEISSTEVRNRLASGDDASQLLDNAVLTYIIEHRLYGCRPKKSDT